MWGSTRVRHLAGMQLGQDQVCPLQSRHGPCPRRQAAIPIPGMPAKATAPFRQLFGGGRATASSQSRVLPSPWREHWGRHLNPCQV